MIKDRKTPDEEYLSEWLSTDLKWASLRLTKESVRLLALVDNRGTTSFATHHDVRMHAL
jgi:hypothetical protein